MKFLSTRNRNNTVNFENAVLNCMPSDGGLYVPEDFADLRRWLLYTDEKTSFSNIAGTLTSACINDDFSPIICETIASKAFFFQPEIFPLQKNIFALKLYETPTGSHKDFGISYLVNCIETIHSLNGGFSIFLDATNGELGASLARFVRDKKHIKALLLYPKGSVRGLSEQDFFWNGGNVYPLEVDGTEQDCDNLVRKIFSQKELVEKFHLTVANTANIGRLLPQMFFYPFAFSRLKQKVHGDIFYSIPCRNYSNLAAGLYSWKLSLPVNGFFCPATPSLTLDSLGSCIIPDDMVPFNQREPSDPASPSNLERLESIFNSNSLMLKNFIYPSVLSEEKIQNACQELFMKYGILADKNTSSAWAAITEKKEMLEEDEGTAVLVMRDHPALNSEYVRHSTGEMPEIPENIQKAFLPVQIKKPLITEALQVIKILETLI